MRYLHEFRDGEAVKRLAQAIANGTTRPWTIMEVCGGQTHSIVRYGIDTLLPSGITLVHGPGCPVCVTPLETIDKAIRIASKPGVVFCSFGDMLRVPGSTHDLLTVKANGGDVRVVYSPLDAVKIARDEPGKEVVFFAVGFETTAPANALAIVQAFQEGLKNFSVLVSQVLVPPAMKALLSSPQCRVQGFLAAGHVCAVMGYHEYLPVAEQYRVPIVVTGFEPVDLLQGVWMCLRQLEAGRFVVENQYSRSVRQEGNVAAQKLMQQVFRVTTRKWRGLGEIRDSGLMLQDTFRAYDAETRFNVVDVHAEESPECISGLILQGLKRPGECPAFGGPCTPEHPLGATMVSSEGACAAYYRYRGQSRTLRGQPSSNL